MAAVITRLEISVECRIILVLNVTFSRHLEQNFYQCVKTIENKVLQIQFDLNKTKIMPKFCLAIFDKNKIYDSKLQ